MGRLIGNALGSSDASQWCIANPDRAAYGPRKASCRWLIVTEDRSRRSVLRISSVFFGRHPTPWHPVE